MSVMDALFAIVGAATAAVSLWFAARSARSDRLREEVILNSFGEANATSKGATWFPLDLDVSELEKQSGDTDEPTSQGLDRDSALIASHERDLEEVGFIVSDLTHRLEKIESLSATTPEERNRLEFRRLWDEAQTRLAKYHELAVIQGRQSFRMLLVFSALGFGLLGFVVWNAANVDSTAGGIALGAAGAAGGALTAFISRTFMRTYRDANERLVDYFAEPLDMSRLLASERLLASVDPTARSDAALRIIDGALTSRRSTATENPGEQGREQHQVPA